MGGNSPSHMSYEEDGDGGRVSFVKGIRLSDKVIHRMKETRKVVSPQPSPDTHTPSNSAQQVPPEAIPVPAPSVENPLPLLETPIAPFISTLPAQEPAPRAPPAAESSPPLVDLTLSHPTAQPVKFTPPPPVKFHSPPPTVESGAHHSPEEPKSPLTEPVVSAPTLPAAIDSEAPSQLPPQIETVLPSAEPVTVSVPAETVVPPPSQAGDMPSSLPPPPPVVLPDVETEVLLVSYLPEPLTSPTLVKSVTTPDLAEPVTVASPVEPVVTVVPLLPVESLHPSTPLHVEPVQSVESISAEAAISPTLAEPVEQAAPAETVRDQPLSLVAETIPPQSPVSEMHFERASPPTPSPTEPTPGSNSAPPAAEPVEAVPPSPAAEAVWEEPRQPPLSMEVSVLMPTDAPLLEPHVEPVAPSPPAEASPVEEPPETAAPLPAVDDDPAPVALPPPPAPFDVEELRMMVKDELQKSLEQEISQRKQELQLQLEEARAQARAEAQAAARVQVQDEVRRTLEAERAVHLENLKDLFTSERMKTEDERLMAQLYWNDLKAQKLEEREKDLKKQDILFKEQIAKLEAKTAQFYKVSAENFQKGKEEAHNRFARFDIKPVCGDLQSQILKCYRENTGKTLSCSGIASAYMQCVNTAKQNKLSTGG